MAVPDRSTHERDEAVRAEQLLAAEARASALFDAVVETGIIRPGITDKEASREITALAAERFGVEKHWHKRIVRSGPNTLSTYRENPPDRVLTEDDIAFADFGPIFDGWEADFGRTWVIGDDPDKRRLQRDVAAVWAEGKAHFDAHPDLTGEELYRAVVALAAARGWTFGHVHCGHLVGEFPHEDPPGGREERDLMVGNHDPIRSLDPDGRLRHWILEIHLVDRAKGIGAFHEQLLTLP